MYYEKNFIKSDTIKTALIVLATVFSFSALGQYLLKSSDVSVGNDGNIADCSITDFNIAAYQNGNIEIPEQIDGITIVRISGSPYTGWVFNNKGITAVTFPSSLEQIGSSAFAGNAISSLTILEGVTIISPYAFDNNNITSVSLPSTLKEISNNVFSGNSGLTSVTLPINNKVGFSGWKDNNANIIIIPDTLQNQEVIAINANVFSGYSSY